MTYWAFIPVSELVALVVIAWSARDRIPLSKTIDLFFSGHGLWLLWFVGVSLVWSFEPQRQGGSFPFSHITLLLVGSALVMLWSGYIDYCFVRVVLVRSRMRAIGDLIIQRLLSWTLIFVTFTWASLSAEFSGRYLS